MWTSTSVLISLGSSMLVFPAAWGISLLKCPVSISTLCMKHIFQAINKFPFLTSLFEHPILRNSKLSRLLSFSCFPMFNHLLRSYGFSFSSMTSSHFLPSIPTELSCSPTQIYFNKWLFLNWSTDLLASSDRWIPDSSASLTALKCRCECVFTLLKTPLFQLNYLLLK